METEDNIVEETTEKTENTEPDFFNMSDAEIEGMELPPISNESDTSGTETTDENDTENQSSDDSDSTDDSESTTQDSDEEAADSDSDTSDESDDGASDDQSTEDVDEDAVGSESSEESDNTDDKDNSKADTVSAEDQMKKLLSPFRANGKDIQVDTVDDAITLMKMGANYNKKMAALKPNLKIVKMLENEGLLDEGKLSNLIDLSKKNPAAIKQLIKDSGIDPLEIDVKEDTGYTPETYTVDDNDIELDLVLSDLKDTPKFSETMDIISNKFDAASKKVLVDSPGIIRVLNEHVELGIYTKISAVIERERMLGRLTGLNDIEAYKQVSDAINAKGGIAQDSKSTSERTDKSESTTTVKSVNKTKARKKSAAVTKSAQSKKADKNVDVLAMSDEEIEAMPLSKYM